MSLFKAKHEGLQGKYPYLGEHHFCWGTLFGIEDDRNGEHIVLCDKCGQMFYTSETNIDGADVMIYKEFGPDDEP